MNICLKGNPDCNFRFQIPNLTHQSPCCNRNYCDFECYTRSFHKCNKCGANKHICEFKSIDSKFHTGVCVACNENYCRFNQKCFKCNNGYQFGKYIDCPKCNYYYCSNKCYNMDLIVCPKCNKKLHRCQFLKNGNCKNCK